MRRLVIVIAIFGLAHSAHAHGIAGNRFFRGTLSFDDPAVADESILPLFSSSKHPDEGGDVVDKRFSWSIFRLLTPTLGVGVDSGWVHRDCGTTCTRRWCRRDWAGGSATRARKEPAPTRPI